MLALPFAVYFYNYGLCARFIYISSFGVHTFYHLTITSMDEDLGIWHFHDEARATAPNIYTHTHTHTTAYSHQLKGNRKRVENNIKIKKKQKRKKKWNRKVFYHLFACAHSLVCCIFLYITDMRSFLALLLQCFTILNNHPSIHPSIYLISYRV